MAKKQTDEEKAKLAMMRKKIVEEYKKGNPAAIRMVEGTQHPYRFGNGDSGTHYMASMDNFAVPQLQEKDGALRLEDFPPRSAEAIRFDNPEDAEYFAEHYKEVAPAFNKTEDMASKRKLRIKLPRLFAKGGPIKGKEAKLEDFEIDLSYDDDIDSPQIDPVDLIEYKGQTNIPVSPNIDTTQDDFVLKFAGGGNLAEGNLPASAYGLMGNMGASIINNTMYEDPRYVNPDKMAASSALSMAGQGAQLGTMIAPGIGTAIGAGVGAIGGAIYGKTQGEKVKDEQQRMLQEKYYGKQINVDPIGMAFGGFLADGGDLGGNPTDPNTPMASPANVVYDPVKLKEFIDTTYNAFGKGKIKESDPTIEPVLRGLWENANLDVDNIQASMGEKNWYDVPWSAATVSNLVMNLTGKNAEDLRNIGFRTSAAHSQYITDAFKAADNEEYKYDLYKPSRLEANEEGKYKTFDVGDILFRGRGETSDYTYDDFKKKALEGDGHYISHTDMITGKGQDEKGHYYETTGGNLGNTMKVEKLYYDPETGKLLEDKYKGAMVFNPYQRDKAMGTAPGLSKVESKKANQLSPGQVSPELLKTLSVEEIAALGKASVGQMANGGDITEINGPTHENGGVPMGPNAEVEGGEVRAGDYIFSDRLTHSETGKTFAEEAEKIKKKYGERDDSITNRSKENELNKLMHANESARLQKEAEEQELQLQIQEDYYAYGGMLKKADGGFVVDKEFESELQSLAKKRGFKKADDYYEKLYACGGHIKKLVDGGPVRDPNLTYGANLWEPEYLQALGTLGYMVPGLKNPDSTEMNTGYWPEAPMEEQRQQTYSIGRTGAPATGIPATGIPATGIPATGIPALPPINSEDYFRTGPKMPQAGIQTIDTTINDLPGAGPSFKDKALAALGNLGNLGKGEGGKGLDEESIALMASNLPAFDNLLQSMRPEVESYDRIKPNTIDLSQARLAAERQAAQARDIQRENIRGTGRSSGQVLSNLGAGNAAISDQLGNQLLNTYMTEQQMNTGILNQAQLQNQQISMQETIANAQNRAMAASTRNLALSDFGQNTQGYVRDRKLARENVRQNDRLMSVINAIAPNYKWEDDNGEYAIKFLLPAIQQMNPTSSNAYGGYILPKI